MTQEFYHVLLYSLALTVGAFLIFYGYRYIIRSLAGNTGTRAYIKVKQSPENAMSGEACLIFTLPEEQELRVLLMDASEKQIRVLFEGRHAQGDLMLRWNSTELPDGEYFFYLQAPNQQIQRKFRIRNQA